MKLNKSHYFLHFTTSIIKRSTLPSYSFNSLREYPLKFNNLALGKSQEELPLDSHGFQTIQFYSKEIAKSESMRDKFMDLKNDPRDFEIYYFGEEENKNSKVRKRRASKTKKK